VEFRNPSGSRVIFASRPGDWSVPGRRILVSSPELLFKQDASAATATTSASTTIAGANLDSLEFPDCVNSTIVQAGWMGQWQTPTSRRGLSVVAARMRTIFAEMSFLPGNLSADFHRNLFVCFLKEAVECRLLNLVSCPETAKKTLGIFVALEPKNEKFGKPCRRVELLQRGYNSLADPWREQP
jgi:hypothetical protein